MGTGLQYIPSNLLKYFLLYIAFSPIKTPIFKFSTRNPMCGLPSPRARLSGKIENSPIKKKIFKILQSNLQYVNSPIKLDFPAPPRVPEILPVNVKKGLLRNKPISKDHTLYYYTPLRPLEPRVPRAL